MYSLALIIFVVSEKKAFEHFLIQGVCFHADRKSKMATTAGHRLTLDPMGKCSNAFFSETTNMIKAKLDNLPMIIPGQFGFNCPSGFREEAF
jgi:hypothetical protein